MTFADLRVETDDRYGMTIVASHVPKKFLSQVAKRCIQFKGGKLALEHVTLTPPQWSKLEKV
jgi:hypothetical protein